MKNASHCKQSQCIAYIVEFKIFRVNGYEQVTWFGRYHLKESTN